MAPGTGKSWRFIAEAVNRQSMYGVDASVLRVTVVME